MRTLALNLAALAVFLVTIAVPLPRAQQDAKSQASSAPGESPITALPYSPSLDPSSMDRSVDPCADLYTYACGGWMKKNLIPPDQPSWAVYGKLYEDNQRFLWGILQDLSQRTTGRTPDQQKIGDYFAACMDTSAVEKLGLAPLQPRLQRIAGLKSKSEIPAYLGSEHLLTHTYEYGRGPMGALFRFTSDQDLGNSDQVIAYALAGGLGLPDRDYYTKTDNKSQELRNQYLAHVGKMLQLAGEPAAMARHDAATVLLLETELAKASLTRVEQRDPYKLYHRMTRQQLQALTPNFNWSAYLQAVGHPQLSQFNVTEPAFYQEVDRILAQTSLSDLKTYFRWHLLHQNAPYLSSAFVQEDFNFYSRTLRGVQQMPARWKRCVRFVNRDLTDPLGKEFVARTFTPEMKQRTLAMTRRIEQAMEEEIQGLTWMGPQTKQQAVLKLHSIVNKIGYPDKWRDYSSVSVARADFLGNVQHATVFESRRELDKIGKPPDRTEWMMPAPTVDAYYNPQMNDINFPAGVLQPPLYDPKMDDAPNYGDTGSTIGHELTHGFDDEGSKFDARGNLRNWWSKQDEAEFNRRTSCVADQYAKYTVVDNIKINSRLTLGEDVADLGGTILAYEAWQAATKGQKLEDRDGLTPEQRYFVGFAQWDCSNERPENLRLRAMTDEHSPAQYRINGVVVNMPQFQQAFHCKANAPLVRKDRCVVW
ncbi:MAG TPA: M13 family metallopeptidase [Terriglobales bacterium]|nr:M13 family metallopeptidase [Terriglobales bacterium]